MPTRKAGKKAPKKAAKKISPKVNIPLLLARIRRQEWVMYGLPIWNVAATGNLADMRRVSTATRSHLADVQRSIAKLDAAIRAGGK